MTVSVEEAKKLAKKKHAHQTRKDGKTPYFNHLKKVVKNIESFGITDKQILCAGWLHDTIEDTDVDYDEIHEKFGKKIADYVAWVTKDTRLIKESQEKQYITQLKKAPWQAKVVKLGDVLANFEDLKNSGYDFKKQQSKVENKIPYILAIKNGIKSNKNKIPNLNQAEDQLNSLLEKFNQKPLSF
jgi:(p)ppGpp synthase/HD superfamily hydrolase